MKLSRTTMWALGAVLLIGLSAIGLAQAPQGQPPATPLVDANRLRMQPEQAATGHHYDGAKAEDVIVQIMGIGPVQTVQTEVDEKGQPVSRGGGGGRGRGAQQ